MTPTRLLALAASSALAACGPNPNKIEPTGPATAGALCQAVTSAFIDRVVGCLGVPLAWAQQGGVGPQCSHWDASVAAGRLRYDQFYGDACVNLLLTTPCDQLFGPGGNGPPGPCGQALQGLVQPPGVCVTDEDCAAGSYCDFNGCTGLCKAYATANQQCWDGASAFTRCAAGLTCTFVVAGNYTCQPPIPLGSPCPSGRYCADGLYCDISVGPASNYTCRLPKTSGQCAQQDACLLPFYHCSGANISPTAPGSCQPVAREGQSCKNGYGDCVGGTYCNTPGNPTPLSGTSGSCTLYPGPGPTSTCGAYGSEKIRCLGSYCNITPPATTGLCTGYIPLGSACSPTGPSDECGPGNSCTGTTTATCAVTCP